MNLENYHRKSTREGVIMWPDMFIGSFVERSRKQLLKIRTLRFYGTSPFSATERLKQGDQILFLALMSVGRKKLSVCQNNVVAFSCCCKVL